MTLAAACNCQPSAVSPLAKYSQPDLQKQLHIFTNWPTKPLHILTNWLARAIANVHKTYQKPTANIHKLTYKTIAYIHKLTYKINPHIHNLTYKNNYKYSQPDLKKSLPIFTSWPKKPLQKFTNRNCSFISTPIQDVYHHDCRAINCWLKQPQKIVSQSRHD